MREMLGPEEAGYEAGVEAVSAKVVASAAAVGMAAMGAGFLLVGAPTEALEGLVTSAVLIGLGHVGIARESSAESGVEAEL